MHSVDAKCLEGEWDSSCQNHQQIGKGQFAQDNFTRCDVLLAAGFDKCPEDGYVPWDSDHVQRNKAKHFQDGKDVHCSSKAWLRGRLLGFLQDKEREEVQIHSVLIIKAQCDFQMISLKPKSPSVKVILDSWLRCQDGENHYFANEKH